MISEIHTHEDPILTREEAIEILNTPDDQLDMLIERAGILRKKYKGNRVSIHILTNVRSGNCTQDCAYCAQSCRSDADIDTYKWVDDDKLYNDNDFVNEYHLSRHCIGLSGMGFTDADIEQLAGRIRKMKETGTHLCCSIGFLTEKQARMLKDAGLDRVNISLDTLDPSLFGKITRLGRLEQTMAGIDAALAWGFEPVKVNCVVVRRLNQDVAALARLTLDRPIHLRFIEYMPIGDERTSSHCAVDPHAPALNPELWDVSDTVPSDELRARINAGAAATGLGELETLDINDAPAGAGPARYWHFPDAVGTVGFISAMSNHFCANCNRLRLTADGNVRPCLFSDAEYSVREALRRGDDMQVLSIWRDAVAHKPQEHAIIEGTQRFMSQIGG